MSQFQNNKKNNYEITRLLFCDIFWQQLIAKFSCKFGNAEESFTFRFSLNGSVEYFLKDKFSKIIFHVFSPYLDLV